MAKKKKKSRIKKIFKNLAKVAALGGAAYGASKLFGGPKKHWANTASSVDSGRAGDSASGKARADSIIRGQFPFKNTDPILHGGVGTKLAPEGRSWGSYFGLKKGGRVTGIAKRGFGRALMKGKK